MSVAIGRSPFDILEIYVNTVMGRCALFNIRISSGSLTLLAWLCCGPEEILFMRQFLINYFISKFYGRLFLLWGINQLLRRLFKTKFLFFLLYQLLRLSKERLDLRKWKYASCMITSCQSSNQLHYLNCSGFKLIRI